MTIVAPRSRAALALASERSRRCDLAVDFERDTGGGRGVDQPAHVELVRIAPQQNTAGRMADDVDERVRDGAEHAIGHLRFVLVERRMDGRDDDVELGEAVVREVHRAVRTDVAFDAGQQRDAVEPVADLANAPGVREGAVLVEAVRHRERFAVIGNRQVLKSGARAPRAPSSRCRRGRRFRSCGSECRRGCLRAGSDCGRARRSAASSSPRPSRSSGGISARPSAS